MSYNALLNDVDFNHLKSLKKGVLVDLCEKLKKENDEYEEQSHKNDLKEEKKIDELQQIIDSQEEENKKLKKENEKLKEENEEIQFRLDGMTCDRNQKEEDGDKLYEKNEELKEENEKLKEEKDKLKEENKELREMMDNAVDKFIDTMKVMKKIQQKHKKLNME